MPTESYTRITATRILDPLSLDVSLEFVDKIINRSRGFCYTIIKTLAIFTSLKQKINQITSSSRSINKVLQNKCFRGILKLFFATMRYPCEN